MRTKFAILRIVTAASDFTMKKHLFLLLLAPFLVSACVTKGNQMAAFSSEVSQVQQRKIDSRMFETGDETLVLQAVVGVLLDTGFKVTETNMAQGLISAQKGKSGFGLFAGRDVRITVTTFKVTESKVRVRATLQDISTGMDPRYIRGEQVRDARVYQEFFDKLAQSLFLEANQV
ncbi:hypothetical protein HED22_18345 [Thalassospira sp. HF15]|nr:hypothetical protein [Thalassospira sp. HF15]